MIEFKPCKNQETTAIANGFMLHSSYNPSREAERYVENLSILPYEDTIILLEPAISYCLVFLRKKYPDKKIGVIRFSDAFEEFNKGFDFVINHFDINNNLDEILFNKLGEERLFSVHFAEWEASKNAFPELYQSAVIKIKESLEKAKTLLVTREYFEKKWFLNSLSFIKYINKKAVIQDKIKKDVLILASGPSIHTSIEIIKNNQEKFFIICLSSALPVCKYYGIRIDLCISTDGGFWAGQHLKHIAKDTILALSPESFVSKKTLEDNPILPLAYPDGISKKILDLCNFTNTFEAERNGTVSGTAAKFALKYFSGNIYFLGLDLANGKGFQHEQPNEIETNNSLYDFKINSKEKRSYKSEISEGSLKIYRQWFENNSFENKVFRVIDSKNKKLGSIKDIKSSEFKQICMKIQQSTTTNDMIMFEENRACIKKLTNNKEQLFNSENLKQLFPLTSLSLKHSPENSDLQKRLLDEKNKLLKKLEDYCNE